MTRLVCAASALAPCVLRAATALAPCVLRATIALALVACTRPSEDRAAAELAIGAAELSDVSVEVAGGLAAVRELGDHALELWAQAPDLTFRLSVGATAAGAWTITVRNALPDAVLSAPGGTFQRAPDQHPTVARFELPLAAGAHQLRVAPPDADVIAGFRVVAMADIQTALPEVDDVFERISAVQGARFVLGIGDITERAELAEYELFDRQLQALAIPFYTTLGNHELWADFARFHSRYGRASFHFRFKGAAFSFADSGDGGLDPLVEDWLAGWLAGARDDVHVFLTHMPPIDPVGTRYGGFRSAQDGRRLLSRMAEGGVDLTLYGHVHTLVEFENAGIPAFITGGGGAEPMRWDDINRHFLVIDIDPERGRIRDVAVERVD